MKVIRVICTVGVLTIIVLLLILYQGLGNTPKRLMPENGIWYCDELQIQLSFEDYEPSYIVVDGVEIKCAVGNDRGSKLIMISSQEHYSEHFRLDETILAAWHVSLAENRWIMQDDAGREYVFVRKI